MAPRDYGLVRPRRDLADPTVPSSGLESAQDDPAERRHLARSARFTVERLTTQDEKAALAFYRRHSASDTTLMPMPQGTYNILKARTSSKRRGGLCRRMEFTTPSMWMQ